MLLEDYRQVDKVPANYLDDASRDEIVDRIGDELWRDFVDTSLEVEHNKGNNQRARRTSPLRHFVERCLTGPLIRATKRIGGGEQGVARSFHLERRFAMEEKGSRIWNYLRKFQYEAKLASLRRYYAQVSVQADWSCKFVFFALHYQPERTTTPQAGVFSDQILALKILASALPQDVRIFVKEHPMQFGASGSGAAIFRTKHFYDELRNISGVCLIDIGQDSKELIGNAAFTATMMGSSGWEGLVAGKPSIVFAKAWYSACNSCFVVKSDHDARAAVESIADKTPEDVQLDVLKFLAFHRDAFVVGGVHDRMTESSSRSFDQLVEGAADALAMKIRSVTSLDSGDAKSSPVQINRSVV
ncbi:MAG TPA: hypothetical protein QF564_12185 [Pirellulaceae bacterium]|nr:hypothetical protein [Pirellulaceae bacterium]